MQIRGPADLPPIVFSPTLPVYVDQSIRYTDYLSIVLSALAVILAVLPIGLATVGLIGYNAILKKVEARAREIAATVSVDVATKNTAEHMDRLARQQEAALAEMKQAVKPLGVAGTQTDVGPQPTAAERPIKRYPSKGARK